jgi:hypothetical protein
MDTLNWASQMQWLFTLSLPLACIVWTITHEEIFREPRELCIRHSKQGKTLLKRKFFYLFTCEYCFSHYVAILILLISDFKMIFSDWRGYFVAGFSLVWISNICMAFFSLLRFGIKKEKIEISVKEEELKNLPGK